MKFDSALSMVCVRVNLTASPLAEGNVGIPLRGEGIIARSAPQFWFRAQPSNPR